MALRGRGYRLMRLGEGGAWLYLPEVYSSQQKAGEALKQIPKSEREYVVIVRETKPERRAE